MGKATVASKAKPVFRAFFIVIALAAIIYCGALLVFGVRLDYEARKLLCGDDKLCRAKLWMEYKKK